MTTTGAALRGGAMLVFGHRGFGDSGGEADLFHPDRQLEDWRAAIAFARSRQGIDAELAFTNPTEPLGCDGCDFLFKGRELLLQLDGPAAAFELLGELDLEGYQPFDAARADLLQRLGRAEEAAREYERAAALAPTDAEREFLARGGRAGHGRRPSAAS